jgi:hypothetical protein
MARRHSRLVGMSMDRKRLRRQAADVMAEAKAASAKFLRAQHGDPMVRAADGMYAALREAIVCAEAAGWQTLPRFDNALAAMRSAVTKAEG